MFSYMESTRNRSTPKPPTPSSSHRLKRGAWQTPPRTGEQRENFGGRDISPPPSGPISPRESSLSRGHNALTDLRRLPNDRRSEPIGSRSRGSQNRSAPTSRSEVNSGGLAARFSKSAEKNVNLPPTSGSYFPRSDGLSNQSRIPLTGDQETDANIMAFLKARDNILQEQAGK